MKTQVVKKKDNWLYYEFCENERLFEKEVSLPDSEPFWPECTNDEKEQWEAEHPQPEEDLEE